MTERSKQKDVNSQEDAGQLVSPKKSCIRVTGSPSQANVSAGGAIFVQKIF